MHQNSSSLLNDSFAAYNAGDYRKAADLAAQAKNIYGNDINILHLLAVSSRHIGDYIEAIDNIIAVLSHDINHYGAVHNFNEIIKDSINHYSNIEDKKQKEKIIFSCYRAVNFASLHHTVIDIGYIFPALVLNMIKLGYNQEAINLTRKAFKIASQAKHPLICNQILLDLGISDEESLRSAAEAGIKLIRENKDLTHAFSAVMFWCYWKNKEKSLKFFFNLMFKKMDIATILGANVLHCWYLTRIDTDFYKDNVYKTSLNIHYTKNNRARQTDGEGVILVSVDEKYWNRFARHLVHDCLMKSSTVSVHACIMNASAATHDMLAEWQQNHPRFGYSVVDIDKQHWVSDINKTTLIKTYYACNRFMIIEDMLDLYQKPIITLDGDQVPIGDMDEFISRLLAEHDGDAAIHYGTRLGPGRELVCDLAAFRPTPATYLLFSLISKYIGHFLSRDYALWMLDQAAFYAVFSFLRSTGMAPRLSLVKQEVFPFDTYLFHAPGNVDKDEMLHAKRSTHAGTPLT